MKAILSLALVLGIAVLVYWNRDRVGPLLDRLRGREAEVAVASPALAAAADAKLEDLRTGRARTVALTELELQSLLQYRYRQLLPTFVDSPRVEINGEQLEVRARVPVDRLPSVSELGEAAGFLPDTTELAVAGTLLPLTPGRVALAVNQVRAARIPLPQRLVPGALRRLGRQDEPGLPADAIAVPLPPGADAAYVRGDSLVFISNQRRAPN